MCVCAYIKINMFHEHVSDASAMNLSQQSKACTLATRNMLTEHIQTAALMNSDSKKNTNGKPKACHNNPNLTQNQHHKAWKNQGGKA